MGVVAGGQICGRCWRLATGGEGDRLLLLWCSLEAGVDGLPSLLLGCSAMRGEAVAEGKISAVGRGRRC
jgi:hypothetical protein